MGNKNEVVHVSCSFRLHKNDIKRFQTLWSKHFSEDLNDDNARKQLSYLVRQASIVYGCELETEDARRF